MPYLRNPRINEQGCDDIIDGYPPPQWFVGNPLTHTRVT